MDKHGGACSCGAVEYTQDSEILKVVNCHCNMCRRHSGAPFSTYAVFPFKTLEITKGSDLVAEYKVGEGNKRFCSACGTPLFNTTDVYPGFCMIYLGTLNNADNLQPAVNIWCESKLGWIDDISGIPSIAQSAESKNA